MTPLEIIALVAMSVVLVLLFYRPRLGIMALVVYFPFDEHVPRLPIPGFNAETLLVAVAATLTLLRAGGRLPALRYFGPVIGVVLVFVLSFGVASVNQSDVVFIEQDSWEFFKAAKASLFPSLFFLFSYWWFPTAEDRLSLMKTVSYTLIMVSFAGALDFVMPYSGIPGRATGLLGAPNILGAVIAVYLLAPLYLFTRPEVGLLQRGLHGFAYAFGQLVLLLTLSRSSWLAVAAAHLVYLAYANRALLILGAGALVLTLTVGYAVLPELVRDRIDETFTSRNRVYWGGGAERFGSGSERIIYYQIGAEMFLESPIWGHGLKAFMINTPKYGAKYGLAHNSSPHSIYIEVATESGLIGLSVFAWLLLTGLVVGHRIWRNSDEDRALGPLFLGTAIGIAVASMFQPHFFSAHIVGAYYWLMFGLVSRADEEMTAAQPARSRIADLLAAREQRPAPAPVLAQLPRESG